MNSISIGLIAAGGFLLGVGMGHIVLFSNILATVGVVIIALGLMGFFWKFSFRGKTKTITKRRN